MDKEAEATRLEDEIAEQCGILNVATGRLVSLIGKVLETGFYAGAGIAHPSSGWRGDAGCRWAEPGRSW